MYRKFPWSPKESDDKGCSTQTAFQENPSWLRDACTHRRGSWDIPNTDCEPGKSEWLAKGKLEEMPHISNFHCHLGTTQGLSCESSCVFLHKYCTFFLLINTLLTLLLSILVEILFCKTEGQGPFTDHWSSASDPVLSQPQPSLSLLLGTQTPLQPIAGWSLLRITSSPSSATH